MPKPEFDVRIAGAGVSPETVRAGDLAALLIHLERSVHQVMGIRGEVSGVPLSLVRIEQGSDRLTFGVMATAVSAVVAITVAIKTGDYADIPLGAHKSLRELSELVSRREWLVEFEQDKDLGIRRAVISANSEVPDPRSMTTRGTTTIFGECVMVGGASDTRARIRLRATGQLLSIDMTEELCKELAPRLYEDVAIEGEAFWRQRDRQIVAFRATRIADYRPGSLDEGFREMAGAAHGRWDDVDAEEYVRLLRGEDEE
jgi:hypothetical protein